MSSAAPPVKVVGADDDVRDDPEFHHRGVNVARDENHRPVCRVLDGGPIEIGDLEGVRRELVDEALGPLTAGESTHGRLPHAMEYLALGKPMSREGEQVFGRAAGVITGDHADR